MVSQYQFAWLLSKISPYVATGQECFPVCETAETLDLQGLT